MACEFGHGRALVKVAAQPCQGTFLQVIPVGGTTDASWHRVQASTVNEKARGVGQLSASKALAWPWRRMPH